MNKLKSLVDADVYLKLLVMLAGETVYFPAAGTADNKQQRNGCIRDDYFNRGLTVLELAEIYGLSESQIRRILKDRTV
ncbi:MAG: Mor transcription activator family protein [Eubacteriales bacterium]|nr:Mor transcription activator family protein [Eubacteriales bacterium]